jgi:hypothetical protein
MLALLFSIYTIGFSLGMVPAFIYGKLGGDEKFKNDNPIVMKILHYLHHWMLGEIIILVSSYCLLLSLIGIELGIFFLAFGLSMYLDDAFYHSFSQYFVRKT